MEACAACWTTDVAALAGIKVVSGKASHWAASVAAPNK